MTAEPIYGGKRFDLSFLSKDEISQQPEGRYPRLPFRGAKPSPHRVQDRAAVCTYGGSTLLFNCREQVSRLTHRDAMPVLFEFRVCGRRSANYPENALTESWLNRTRTVVRTQAGGKRRTSVAGPWHSTPGRSNAFRHLLQMQYRTKSLGTDISLGPVNTIRASSVASENRVRRGGVRSPWRDHAQG